MQNRRCVVLCQALSGEPHSVRTAETTAIRDKFNLSANQRLTQNVSNNRMAFVTPPNEFEGAIVTDIRHTIYERRATNYVFGNTGKDSGAGQR